MKFCRVSLRVFVGICGILISLWGGYLGVFIVVRWLRLFDVLHAFSITVRLPLDELRVFAENTPLLSFAFATGVYFTILGLLILFLAAFYTRRLFLIFVAILITCAVLMESVLCGFILKDIPSRQEQMTSLSGKWEELPFNSRLEFQSVFNCCGFANYTDRAVFDNRHCISPDRLTHIPADIPVCSKYLLKEEHMRWIPVYVYAICPLVLLLLICCSNGLLYRLTRRKERMEMKRSALRAFYTPVGQDDNRDDDDEDVEGTQRADIDEQEELKKWLKY